MKVRVCVGSHSCEWPYAANRKGMVVWQEKRELKALEFPIDFHQIPDILVYLIRETDDAPVSFLRVSVVELLSEHLGAPPRFYHLLADQSRKVPCHKRERDF